MYKQFSITKNKYKKTETQPDYRMSIKIGEEFVEVASLWLKEAKDKSKYFSGKMNDVYVDHTKGIAKKGFIICEDSKNEPLPIKDKPIEDNHEIPF